MEFGINREELDSSQEILVDNFDDLNKLPEDLTEYILTYLQSVSLNSTTKSIIIEKCKLILEQYKKGSTKFLLGLVLRCRDIWLILTGEDYQLADISYNNLIIEELDIMKTSLGESNQNKLEFNAVTGELISNPLSNLIIEEVEVTDYV